RETDRHPNLFRPDRHHLIEHIDAVGPDRIHRRIDAVREWTIVAVATPVGVGFAATPRRPHLAFQMRAVRVGYAPRFVGLYQFRHAVADLCDEIVRRARPVAYNQTRRGRHI